MKLIIAFLVVTSFVFGIISTMALASIFQTTSTNRPTSTTTYLLTEEKAQEDDEGTFITRILGSDPKDMPSPFDRIGEENIKVEKDKVVINIQNAEWSKFTDTNSMDPVIDEGANAIQIVPKSYDEVHVGDIISYKSDYADGTIIHRVVQIGFDEDGWFAQVKGDNNAREDPGKIRFSQIRRIVIAIIY